MRLSFKTYPQAPAFRAASRSCWSSCLLTITTFAPGKAMRISRVAVIPSTQLISMSINTQSGRYFVYAARASEPSPHSSMSLTMSFTTLPIMRRIAAWSSTINSFICITEARSRGKPKCPSRLLLMCFGDGPGEEGLCNETNRRASVLLPIFIWVVLPHAVAHG